MATKPAFKDAFRLRRCLIVVDSLTTNRMPVVIAAEDYDRWLDPQFFDAEELQRMLQPYPMEEMLLE